MSVRLDYAVMTTRTHQRAQAKHQRKRACAYVRVSKIGMRDEGDLISPENQLDHIYRHCKANNYEVVKVVQDIDKSGRDFTKRRIAEMVEDVRNGLYSVIVMWKWSRWGRRNVMGSVFMAHVETLKGQIEAATEHVDARTAYGRFSRSIFLAMAELQGDQIGEGWQDAHAARRRKKLPHTSAPRFGYQLVDKRYVKNPEQAAMLADAYERYVAGTGTIRGFSMEWNAQGVRTMAGKMWSDSAVRVVLDTGFAAGLIRERSEPPKEGSGMGNSKSLAAFDVWREGAHEPIIDMQLWEAYKAKRLLQADAAPAHRHSIHELSGALLCHECGSTLKTAYSYDNGNRYHRWYCRTGRDLKIHPLVSVSNIRALRQVREWVENNALGAGPVDDEVKRLAALKADSEKVRDQVRDRLRDLGKREDRIQESWLDGKLREDFYTRKMAELLEERESLEAEIRATDKRDARIKERPTVEQWKGISAEWPRWEGSYRRAFMDEVLAGILVRPDRSLMFVEAWVS